MVVKRKMKRLKKPIYGGTSLKYGATIEDGQIKRQEVKKYSNFLFITI